MKDILKNTATILLVVIFSWHASSQDNRTLETKVVDILAQTPTKTLNHSDKLMGEVLELGEAGISLFCDMVIPPGTGNDTQARFVLESLARYSGTPDNEAARKLTEQALLDALEKATDKEVKAFFIRRLVYCGGDSSVKALGKYLSDDELYSPAATVLTYIGTEKAGEEILRILPGLNGKAKIHCIKALGEIKYQPAESALIKLAENTEGASKLQCLYALANIGLPTSEKTIVEAAKDAGCSADETEAMVAYIHYAGQLAQNGNKKISNKLCKGLLKECKAPNQLHSRSAALNILRSNQGAKAMALMLKEFKNSDPAYRNAILNYAANGMTSLEVGQWIKAMKKAPDAAKAQIITALAKKDDPQVLQECILPALKEKSAEVRLAAIKALALNQKKKAIPILLEILASEPAPDETQALKNALLETCGVEDCKLLAEKMNSAGDNEKIVLIEVIGARRAVDYFGLVLKNCRANNGLVDSVAFAALQNVAQPEDLSQLLELIGKTSDKNNISAVQQAIITTLDKNKKKGSGLIISTFENNRLKTRILPVFPYLKNAKALKIVTGLVENGSPDEREAALEALVNWKDSDAIPILFNLTGNKSFHAKAFSAYLKQVMNAGFPDDQKLLLARKLMPVATNIEEKKMVLKSAGNIKTFLSLVFIANYIDDDALGSVASSAAMKVILPAPGKEDGLTGSFVKEVAEKVKAGLTGPDSQYFKIDIQEYLDKMPEEEGYTSIFNGKNLSGWQGLVKNPVARSKMPGEELAKEQIKANEKMLENWSVKDGCITFNGKGANICTKKKYGDFDMLVDWRITKNGDSGIYLRGTPQVQIWDTSRVDVGAQVGSGGLYNNKINPSKPLTLADNAIGDWNTFRIKMVGDKVTVYLNGILVVDNVTMENFWDRSMPIFPKEAIELQAHGTDLAFRNIYVREINNGGNRLSEKEKAEGFTLLFNGKDLDSWVGNKTDYRVQNGVIAVRPVQGGHGNLYTDREYSDFIFRFEFQLTPGANNGLGIHAPLKGDAAYLGKELQILDNTAPEYANLKPYQYHGSVYGIIAAKRGFLKPVGEWNSQEVVVMGDDIKIALNGHVILKGNFAEATRDGTADHKKHPGLLRHKGHIGFLGHGSKLQFRNIRIKDLAEQ
ncbi:hypothetical protein MNBD_BACTEROID01-2706 [hydrothermal vent metagenome]|uniref:3-keto-alpha-glucoside-1,2-lyase/3-keto-2-hydroxy-glucal hydratase domain-containing protein n=1 Tax=hydrothermal vent metagenome TaxID=652676 RepID=A0A3B0UBW2_9ZZZZ